MNPSIQCRCVLRSVGRNSAGTLTPELITFEATYPRFIHSEVMTHRVFSRNASSSRAVPVSRMLRKVTDEPVYPSEWGKAQSGMQSGGPMPDAQASLVQSHWNRARAAAVEAARGMESLGAHKQVVNRVLEPYSTITTIITATDWDNFFDLRLSPLADPTMYDLAVAMRSALRETTTQILAAGRWHLPYIHPEDYLWAEQEQIPSDGLALLSAARCARVSYLNHDGTKPDRDRDMALALKLHADKHMSPFEHQAYIPHALSPAGSGQNFAAPWIQHRSILH